MNYIGSKYSLLNEIWEVLGSNHVPERGYALDLFAGTGAVAQLLKARGHIVYANDWQYYSYVTNVAFIEHNSFPSFKRLLSNEKWANIISSTQSDFEVVTFSNSDRNPVDSNVPCAGVLRLLNSIPGSRGPFYELYCQGGNFGRMYYSMENGLRIQAIRDLIEEWHQSNLINKKEKCWLVACLIEAADRVANTASVYGAHLKHVKKTAQKPLALVALGPTPSSVPATKHRVFCQDSNKLLYKLRDRKFQVVYVDPPYNQRQYSSNYHILETISRWDIGNFEPRGATGLRTAGEQRSDFSARSLVENAYRDLFSLVNSDYILFSYNNEGLLSEDKLLSLFEQTCEHYTVKRIKFKRFRADIDHDNRFYKTDYTHEFLILGKLKQQEQLQLQLYEAYASLTPAS